MKAQETSWHAAYFFPVCAGLPHHGETFARYRLPAIRGRPEAGLARLDKLDRTLGRRSVRWMIPMAETRLPLYDPEPSIRAPPEMFGETYIFIRPWIGPSNRTRKYFLRTNKRLETECGDQPSHHFYINQIINDLFKIRSECAFPRKRSAHPH
jgi:hypothetical protein